MEKLNMLMCDVGELKSAVSDILTLSKETKILIGLHRMLRDTPSAKYIFQYR